MGVFVPSTDRGPGLTGEQAVRHRTVSRDGYLNFLPRGLTLDGALTRDPDNPGGPTRLRAGLLVGKVTASGKYANSVIGALQAAAAATDTSVTLTAAQAAELVRRVGTTGTLRFVGPPTAAGTVATFTETYSAVDLTTGVVTVSGLDADLVAGSFACADDGSHAPVTFLPDGWELVVPDGGAPFPLAQPPVAGAIDASKLLPWPADASLREWVKARLNDVSLFAFAEDN